MISLLAALRYTPSVVEAGRKIYEAVSGKQTFEVSPEGLSDQVGQLPEQQQAQIRAMVVAEAERQGFDTQRFLVLTDGNAEKVKATARPEIAMRAMAVVESFGLVFKWLIIATLLQWFAGAVCALLRVDVVELPNLWVMIAGVEPVVELFGVMLAGSFWACVAIVRKYMGCRERDKAQEYEMRNGKPLQSSAATVEAAGSAISDLVRAFKGR